MVRLLLLVWGAFKLWMFIDAVRRDAEQRWFWFIPFVPGGALAYFLVVKRRDYDVRSLEQRVMQSLKRPPSLDELAGRFERTPSLDNRITLAQALFDAERYADAEQHFDAVLAARPKNLHGLYGKGLCRLEQADPAGAIAPLQSLCDEQPGYRDYSAWPELAEAMWLGGQREDCIPTLEALVRGAPRMANVVLLAEYLERAGEQRRAVDTLRDALEEQRLQPRYARKLARPWTRRAEQLLGKLGAR